MQMRSVFCFVVLTACGPSAPAVVPDASIVPKTAAGSFSITTAIDLPVLPPPADALLAELDDATDGPDDPARFLCDRLVAELPESWQAIAAGVADDLVAPVLETELDQIAPRFASGMRSLAAGLGEIAHHARTIETLTIQPNGIATRTITGLAYDEASLDFAREGMADAVATTSAALDAKGDLSIASNHVELPYGALLRLGFDRQVIPNVDFSAGDLATALRDLVDCRQLGELFAAKLGLGSVTLYVSACDAGMAELAADFYARLAAIDVSPLAFDASGAATGVDVDHDGTLDQLDGGVWTGTSSYAGAATALVDATFSGTKQGVPQPSPVP